MSLNSYIVTDEIRPLPGSGWTSKNAANAQDSIAKYKEKLNIPTGQKGYIEPGTFKLKDNVDKQKLLDITPKRSCVVDKPECVKYNYIIPENYLKDGVKNAKIENQILENELDELQADKNQMQTEIGSANVEINRLKTERDKQLQAVKTQMQTEPGLANMANMEIKDQLRTKHDILQAQLGDLQSQHETLEEANEGIIKMLRSSIEELQDELQNENKVLQNENKVLRDENNVLRDENSKARNAVEKFLPARTAGGTRRKKPIERTKTQRRRITRRLRSKKIPRKYFSPHKREK